MILAPQHTCPLAHTSLTDSFFYPPLALGVWIWEGRPLSFYKFFADVRQNILAGKKAWRYVYLGVCVCVCVYVCVCVCLCACVSVYMCIAATL